MTGKDADRILLMSGKIQNIAACPPPGREDHKGVTRFVTLLVILLLLSALTAAGKSVYVAPTGSDSWPGTIDSAYRTITKAISSVSAGDTIWMRGGVYITTATITIAKNGSPSAFYNLWAYPGERPVLDFSSMTESSGNRGIQLSGSYWYIKGIDIKGAGDNGMYMNGSYNVVEFCAFYENRDSGLQLDGGASRDQIINCDSYYNKDTAQGNADGFSPKLGVGDSNYFYGCRSWQNSDDGFDGYLRTTDNVTTIYEKCWSFKNGYLKDGTASLGNGNGFKMGGSDTRTLMHNSVLKNCMAFDNRVKGFDQNNNRGSMTLYNCTGYNNGTNYKISDTVASGKSVTVINCDALGAYGSLAGYVVQETNSWMPPFVVTAADFQSTDPSAAYGPRNADGSLPDISYMHLAPGSDLIDAGTPVGIPFNGAGPDLGAFETPGTPVPTYTLTITATHGTVAKNPDYAAYDSNETVQLTALPLSGYHFTGWTGDLTGSENPVTIVMNGNKSVTALFDLNPLPKYTLTIIAVNGMVNKNPDLTAYDSGSTVQLSPVPDSGYHFTAWSGPDVPAGHTSDNPLTLMMDSDKTVTANFAPNPVPEYTLTIDTTGAGTVIRSPDQPTYTTGTVVRLSALPAPGYAFVNWSGDFNSTNNPDSVTITANMSVTANFSALRETTVVPLMSGWNLLSLPVKVDSYLPELLYPNTSSHAFVYEDGYLVADTLEPGRGYWLKIGSADTASLAGGWLTTDSVPVAKGWNLIGSLTHPVDVTTISSVPGGMIASEFFEYDGAYEVAPVIEPGRGYWVRVSENGMLILSTNPNLRGISGSARIRIRHSDDHPPLPPGEIAGKDPTDLIPSSFNLGQNYPNPFNSTTSFQIALPQNADVDVSVYNLLGEKIALLMQGTFARGYYHLTWDGTTLRGGAASSGVYFVRMSAGSYTGMMRIVLMK